MTRNVHPDIELGEDQALLRETVERLVEDEVAARAQQTDRDGRLADGALAGLAELGLLGIAVPEEHGGAGMDSVCLGIALEELARGCGATAFSVFVHASLTEAAILRGGSADQQARWLPMLASGERIGGAAIEVGELARGGAGGVEATTSGDGAVLSGEATAYGACSSDLLLVLAREPGAGERASSLFLVDRAATPVAGSRWDASLGVRGADVGTVRFDGLAVDADARVGPAGGAEAILGPVRADAGQALASCAVGLARAALERALRYACERTTFDKPIARHEAVGLKLADMATRVEIARRMTWIAANAPHDSALRPIARSVATDAAVKTGYDAIQVLGGYGFSAEYDVERMWRDARFLAEVLGSADDQRRAVAAAILAD